MVVLFVHFLGVGVGMSCGQVSGVLESSDPMVHLVVMTMAVSLGMGTIPLTQARGNFLIVFVMDVTDMQLNTLF